MKESDKKNTRKTVPPSMNTVPPSMNTTANTGFYKNNNFNKTAKTFNTMKKGGKNKTSLPQMKQSYNPNSTSRNTGFVGYNIDTQSSPKKLEVGGNVKPIISYNKMSRTRFGNTTRNHE